MKVQNGYKSDSKKYEVQVKHYHTIMTKAKNKRN